MSQTPARPWIIDADSHVTEPPDVWTARVPSRYVDSVPHVVRTEEPRDVWMLNGDNIGALGTTAPAGWPNFPPEYPPLIEDVHPASFDSSERVKYMDQNGIWAQVLYPNVGGFGSEHFLNLDDDHLKLLCVRAYNDWLHEWCSVAPDRLLGVMATPYWDIDQTVKEIERGIDLGMRGILFTGEPQRFGLPLIGDRHWDPLWEIAAEAKLPIHFHIGNAGVSSVTVERRETHGRMGTQAYGAVELFMKNGVQCADLITCGALERHPDVKFVSVESGMGWLPFMLEAADYSWLGAFRPGRKPAEGDLLPSDLFKRQVYVTYWFESMAPKYLLDVIPLERVLFETDFPHTTCLYENIRETIQDGLGDTTPEVRQMILWDNAAELYGIADPPA